MLLSKPCQHAIRAMTYLAECERARLVPIREISEEAQIPLAYLAKILNSLSRGGLLRARRGPNGGVALERTPSKITIGEIVDILEPLPLAKTCYLGLPECSDEQPCPVHDSWKRVREQWNRTLHARTLRQLTLVSPKQADSRRRRGKTRTTKSGRAR